jgi:hypothetical protein
VLIVRTDMHKIHHYPQAESLSTCAFSRFFICWQMAVPSVLLKRVEELLFWLLQTVEKVHGWTQDTWSHTMAEFSKCLPEGWDPGDRNTRSQEDHKGRDDHFRKQNWIQIEFATSLRLMICVVFAQIQAWIVHTLWML